MFDGSGPYTDETKMSTDNNFSWCNRAQRPSPSIFS